MMSHPFEKYVNVSQFISNIVVLVALPFSIYTYLHQIESEKVSRSLEYVKSFNSDEILASRNVLLDAWEGFDLSKVPQDELNSGFLAEVFDRLLSSKSTLKERVPVEKAISDIANFFDVVEACRTQGTCEEQSLMSTIGSYGHDFYCIYGNHIESQRRRIGNDRLGHGLKAFASGFGPC